MDNFRYRLFVQAGMLKLIQRKDLGKKGLQKVSGIGYLGI